jgi:pimeloyl-ACP methyl ester carboxylesterase
MNPVKSNEVVRTIACLHSSGGSGRQWNALRKYVGERFDVLTPNLIGYGDTGFDWGNSVHLKDEAAAVVGHIQAAGGRAHLVGHSYGGAVATHVALWHPEIVASLTVYEPALFSLLYRHDTTLIVAGEIERVADSITSQLDTVYGRWQGARDFINYWFGYEAWGDFDDRQHARLASLMPKIAAEFQALIRVKTTAAALAEMQLPVRLLCGTATRDSARHIAELIAMHMPRADFRLLDGLGHMAPVTHPDVVNPLLLSHIVSDRSPREAAA